MALVIKTANQELADAQFARRVHLTEKPWHSYTAKQYHAEKHHPFIWSKIHWCNSPLPERVIADNKRHYDVVTSSIRHKVFKGRYAREFRRQVILDIPVNPNDPF